MTEIYLGMPPQNIKTWIELHAKASAQKYQFTISSASGTGAINMFGIPGATVLIDGVQTDETDIELDAGTQVQVIANDSMDFMNGMTMQPTSLVFQKWSDGVTDKSRTFVMSEDVEINAIFGNAPCDFTVCFNGNIFDEDYTVKVPFYMIYQATDADDEVQQIYEARNVSNIGIFVTKTGYASIILCYDGINYDTVLAIVTGNSEGIDLRTYDDFGTFDEFKSGASYAADGIGEIEGYLNHTFTSYNYSNETDTQPYDAA